MKFFNMFLGRIEIQLEDKSLKRVYFRQPYICKFLTNEIKFNLTFLSSRESDEDRLLYLYDNLDFYAG